jgi:NTE family protein
MTKQLTPDDQSFWHDLDDEDRTRIVNCMRKRRLARGEALIECGEPSQTLYIVNFGQFGVKSAETGDIVAEIGKDQLIGEMGFFTGEPRSAAVVAMRDSETLELDRAEFDDLVARFPDLQRAVMRSLAKRLARLAAITRRNARQSGRVRVVALVGAGGGAIPEAFCARLSRAINARVRCSLRTSSDAHAHFNSGGVDRYAVADWLGELERDNDLVVCVADDALNEWTQAVLNSADLLVLAASGESTALNPIETLAFTLFPSNRRRLVRVLPTRPEDGDVAAPWLRERDVFMLHHVALDSGADFDSLARFLTGQAIGFVAGAGGALGLAHIGVMKAFQEAGVVFDMFGGSSIGSGMAVAFAQLKSPAEVEASIHEIFVRNAALKRLTFPKFGLLDHTVLEKTLEQSYGSVAFEDLWRPGFAIATDLSTYTMRVIRSGPTWQAVRASCAIPGVLPPFFDADGHMLVDGAVSDNAPIAPMHALKSGPNLVVDLRNADPRLYDFDYRALPGRNQLLSMLFNPFRRKPLPNCPGLTSVIQQAVFSNIRERPDFSGALDLTVRPPVCPGANFMTWDKHREVAEFSYNWGLETIARLEADGDAALAEMRRLSRPS